MAELLRKRHDRAYQELVDARAAIDHSVEKGDVTEEIWRRLFSIYLPARYEARRAFIIDSKGRYSQQIDVVVHDRFYTPFVFKFGGYHVVPVESVYAVFEVKQNVCRRNIDYAFTKAKSVRILERCYTETDQVKNPQPKPIVSGLLATDGLGHLRFDAPNEALSCEDDEPLDYIVSATSGLSIFEEGKFIQSLVSPVSAFFLDLVARLQRHGTVSPIDISVYSRALQEGLDGSGA